METNQIIDTQTETTVYKSRSRNLTVVVLFILLTVLSAVGIIVAITLQSQAPDDSLAAGIDPKTGMYIADNGLCYNQPGGTHLGYYCGNGCEAAKQCWTGAQLAAFGGGCNAAYDALCQQATCAGDGASPGDGQSCCEGLNLCPNGRCGATCSGVIGGGSGFCVAPDGGAGVWQKYECLGTCNTAGGCNTNPSGTFRCMDPGSDIGECADLKAWLNGAGSPSGSCYVRQADCIGTSGANLVFRSGVRCTNQCSTPPGGGDTDEPPGTGEPNPFCGDAICATNELCERTSPGGSSFRACRAGDIGSTPGGQVVNECYRLTDGTNQVAGTGPRCKFCGDGLFHAAEEQCDGTAPAGDGNDPTNCSSTCNIKVRECLGVNRSATTLAPGVGNKTIFTLRFRDERSLYPYDPGVAMRVSSGSSTETAVGRDANNTSSTLVSLIPGAAGKSRAQQADGSYIYEYKFEWEAANSAGTDVAAGTYTVQFLNNGNPLFEGVAACQSTITISEEQVENPLFTIVKLSTPVCESDNDSRIDYTVRVTNTGPVEGVIDFVRDTLDADVIAAGIVPTAIVPAFGVYGSGQITWEGTVADRTYASQQAKDFTYSVTIPASLVSSFTATGIDNQVVVQYDTEDTDDNTDSFTLNTPITCGTTVVVIPVTGILDDGRFLILGALFVLTGIYVYRRQYVLEHSFETEIERKLSRKADEQD